METSKQEAQAIDLLRRAYESFNRGDIADAVKDLDPEIEWTEPTSFPGGGTYHGQKGVAQYLTQSRAGWAEGRSEPERFVTAGNRVVVLVHAHIRVQGSSDWRDVRLADVYTFHNGKPIQMRAFADRQEALDWAGAKESL
jgi:ketosteroid isomerase-like protein